jgi:enolase
MIIESIDAFQIFDSRGNPTVEVEVTLKNGSRGTGLVPSGASTGQYEALELRDRISRFRGMSVFKAVNNIRTEIAPALKGKDACDQEGIDHCMIELDGTANKSRLGANAILGVSMAAAKAAAVAEGKALFDYLGKGQGYLLPLPEIQIFGGGAHANWRIDVQDFLLIANGAKNYAESLEMTFNVYHAAADILKERNHYCGLADEGGFWPAFQTNEDVFPTFLEAIERAGYAPGRDVSISLDIAASDLYDEESGTYRLKLEDKTISSAAFAELMISWCEKYPIISIEDAMADTDWEGWATVYSALGRKVQLIGDDLFTTNIRRIEKGIERGVANAVLIKLNQIGTVTETLAAIRLTQRAGWLPVVSARSGETEDAFISHLAVASNAGQLKVGAFARSERMVKWNEVLRIERSLGERARFEGGRLYDRILDDRGESRLGSHEQH